MVKKNDKLSLKRCAYILKAIKKIESERSVKNSNLDGIEHKNCKDVVTKILKFK